MSVNPYTNEEIAQLRRNARADGFVEVDVMRMLATYEAREISLLSRVEAIFTERLAQQRAERDARIAELEALLCEADRRIAWDSLGFGNDFANRVDALCIQSRKTSREPTA